ncbi:DUF6779 domain-containing protein [Nocardia sp. XZ_19_385]|uniref:DUF6779 domain-containing protein n=1 Tax=Nocardia sp. XZ_19_385 TaxID=2769488 RepID=UPI0018901D0A|nr:DUF6779 domain-containing protein [Nocardia sp. XZ_19_385]
MVSPSRTSTSRSRRDQAGKLFIGSLILLGLVASVFLVFSNSLQFVRIGLVAALWAAVIGALAATRYRKEATIDKAKARDLQKVYELQLEREVTARREYELGLEARVRQEVGADAAEMAALRAELSVLRHSLQRLFDGELPVERPALRADATRIQELPGGSTNPANNSSANADPWVMGLPGTIGEQMRSSVTPVFSPDHPEAPQFASPFDEPVTAETQAVPREYDNIEDAEITDERRYPDPDRSGSTWAGAFTEAKPAKAAEPKPAPLRLPPPDQPAEPRPPAAPRPRPTTTAAPSPHVGTPTSRRRRRVDAEAESGTGARKLSVAEIMANLQSEENGRA